jgi:hypothetical protein
MDFISFSSKILPKILFWRIESSAWINQYSFERDFLTDVSAPTPHKKTGTANFSAMPVFQE